MFTTYNRDPETGNDYAMARYYAKQYGAFLSPDPGHVGASLGDPLSWNAYVYSKNDSINYVDRDGLWSTPIHNAIIDAAFPFLSSAQRQILKGVSSELDNPLSKNGTLLGGQSNSVSFQHAMRGPFESVGDAEGKYNAFVSAYTEKAGAEQMSFKSEWRARLE